MGKGKGKGISTQILNIERRKYQKSWQSIPHSHYFSEILFIMEGSGSFLAKNQEHQISRGDLILVNPHVLHTEQSTDTHDLEYIVVGVAGIELVSQEMGYAIRTTFVGDNRIRTIMQGMLHEYENQLKHNEEYCSHLLHLLEIEIQRSHLDSLQAATTARIPQECSVVKRHIDVHYATQLSLEELADMVHWSTFYLIHQFQQAYGMSPIAYLRHQRIENSKRLLSGHDLRISEIAISCGFSSPSFFAQTFRTLTGETPSRFRKRSVQENKGA